MNFISIVLLSTLMFAAVQGKDNTSKISPSEKMQAWGKYIKNYKPDYSDGSKYLQPPETNRFSTPFPVVKNGKAIAKIVLPDIKLFPAEITAAEELQKNIEQITGAKLPIVRFWSGALKKKTSGNWIVLGKSFNPDDAVLKKLSGTDGYAIRRNGNKLYVYGFNSKGTLNGVYALLENNTDIIWARPHKEVGTVFSKHADLDFVWGNNVVERPASVVRGWNGYADLEWMARNKCNGFFGGGGGDISWMNAKKSKYGARETLHLFGHNIGHFIYWKKYFKEHPEYYSLVGGKRKPWRQYCFSNPEMKKVFIENVLKVLRRAPEDTDGIHIDMDDTWDACECEKCTAPIKLTDGTLLYKNSPAFRSTQYFNVSERCGCGHQKRISTDFHKDFSLFFYCCSTEMRG